MTSTETGPNSNDGEPAVLLTAPYRVSFTIRGSADLLFHRWSNEDVAAKATAKRGSAVKKTDNLEAYVIRDDDGMVCLEARYVYAALVGAGKFMQDPRSSRAKQACDLFKAAFVPITVLCPLGPKWEIEDKRRMVVNRAGITRTSPGFKAGWEAMFEFDVILPEYVSETMFHEALSLAGRVIGLGQYRPTYGRFIVIKFERVP
jgi:hypothetical protein